MKKGEDVADYEDDDVVRTSVSQDQVTVTLCTEEWFLRTQYMSIALSTHQIGQNMGGGTILGTIQTVNKAHLAIPAGVTAPSWSFT
jgi:hypothetical protein